MKELHAMKEGLYLGFFKHLISSLHQNALTPLIYSSSLFSKFFSSVSVVIFMANNTYWFGG